MIKIARVSVLLLLSTVVAAASGGQDGDDEQEHQELQLERIVVPMQGVHEFTVSGDSTLFRLSISTPSGGTIGSPVITGNAKHLRTAEVSTVGEGGRRLIGALTKEFVFRGTGEGKVTISIERKAPTSPTPVVETFQITIQ